MVLSICIFQNFLTQILLGKKNPKEKGLKGERVELDDEFSGKSIKVIFYRLR
jgi:hypothetical protein